MRTLKYDCDGDCLNECMFDDYLFNDFFPDHNNDNSGMFEFEKNFVNKNKNNLICNNNDDTSLNNISDLKNVKTLELNISNSVHNVSNDICVIKNVNEIDYCKTDGRPFIKVKLNNFIFNSLFDTGAKISVLSESIMKILNLNSSKDINKKISCANGSELRVLGKIILDVEYNGKNVAGEFLVANKIYPNVIIGIDILNKLNVKLLEICDGNILSLQAKFGKNISGENKVNKITDLIQIERKNVMYDTIVQYADIFMGDSWDIGKTDILRHRIVTNCNPILIKPRRQPMHYEEKLEDIIKNLEENEIIKKCESPWNSPIVCVPKKGSNEIRMCLDFRTLNSNTIRPAFPIPNVDEMLDSLHGAKYFSSIDLGNAYYQVELDEESKEKTAFSTRFGQFCFNRMPFGIAAAPSTFQKLMTIIIGDMMWNEALVYLDDILIFSSTIEEHIIRINNLFGRIRKAGLKIKPEKCKFLVRELKFLGHVINEKGIKTDNSKIESIQNAKQPNCVKHIRSFLGLANYYRKFIRDYSKIARPLESLIGGKNKTIMWTEDCEKSFRILKESLTNAPILCHPDFSKIFILDTDASFDCIGAVLSQRGENGIENIIAFGSKSMNKHEIGYCITRKELLSIFHFTQHFKHYLYGKKFILRTDHKAITFMLTTKKPITAQFQNWINFLSSLDMNLEYRKGEQHCNADALSRLNVDACKQCQMQHQDAKTEKLKTRILAMSVESKEYYWQNNSKEITILKKKISQNEESEYYMDKGIVFTILNKIYIPIDRRHDFILDVHRELCHAGITKVINYIKNYYYFKQIDNVVKDVLSSCETCQKRKTYTGKTKEIIEKIEVKEPFENIFIDFCGPFKTTPSGKKYILAMIDQFTKYIVIKAVRSQDDKCLSETLMNSWILKYGPPKQFHVDRGKCFESQVFKNLASKYSIEIVYSSPYHHQANGQIERQFRTIRDWISCCLQEKRFKTWEEGLPHIEFSLNSTIQQNIQCSPAEVVFGRKLCKERFITQIQNDENPYRNFKYEMIRNLNQYKQDESTKRIHRSFNIGDDVLVKVDIRNKQDERYSGPHKIVDKIHKNSYLLNNNSGKTFIRNIEWLKPFKARGM